MLELIGCPECARPAEITDRFTLPSTDGPVDHVVLHCAGGHHFRMPSDLLPAYAQAGSGPGLDLPRPDHPGTCWPASLLPVLS